MAASEAALLPPRRLTLGDRAVGHVQVLEVAGVLDHATAPAFEEAVVGLLQRARPPVLDLSGLSALTPAGAGSLVACAARILHHRRRLVVVRPTRELPAAVAPLEERGALLVDSLADALARA